MSLLLFGRFLSGLMAGSQPIAQAAVSDLSPEDQRALDMSLLTLALSVGIVLGPVMGGVLSERIISNSAFDFATPLWTAAALAAISFLWILVGFRDTAPASEKRSTGCARSGFSRKPSPRPPFARSRSCISCSSSVSASTTP